MQVKINPTHGTAGSTKDKKAVAKRNRLTTAFIFLYFLIGLKFENTKKQPQHVLRLPIIFSKDKSSSYTANRYKSKSKPVNLYLQTEQYS